MDIYEIEDKYARRENRWPVFWKFLHVISIMYDEDFSDHYQEFMEQNLPYMIPCENCADEYMQYIELNPIDYSSRDNFVKWMLDFHNFWNKKKGVKEYTLEEMLEAMDEWSCA